MAPSQSVLPFPRAPDGIELRHLRALIAVGEELNFGRAAERLYMTQPALSRQIRALEILVGCDLLRRSTRRVELTLAGEALLDRARKLLHDVDEAVSVSQAVGGELVARIVRLWEDVGAVGGGAEVADVRRAFEELHAKFVVPPGVSIQPVQAGGVPALIASPSPDANTTVVYLHGGAYVLGSAYGFRAHAGALASAAGTGVLVPDYRLAPEHPFPAAVDDAVQSYRWLLERGVDPQRICVGGDSAGAALSLNMLLRLRNDGDPLPGAVVLLCPWVDLTTPVPNADAPERLAAADLMQALAALYLAGRDPADPVVSPLEADLTGLPRMLIQAATGDTRRADAEALAARARRHGVDVQLQLFAVDAHAFHYFWSFLPEAADALRAAGAFIQACTGSAAANSAAAWASEARSDDRP